MGTLSVFLLHGRKTTASVDGDEPTRLELGTGCSLLLAGWKIVVGIGAVDEVLATKQGKT